MSLSLEALRRADSSLYGALIGLYGYAQWSHVCGVRGPDPRLPYTYLCYRLGRMRRMCYARRLLACGVRALPLNCWRMPRHPQPPRSSPPGFQTTLSFS